jgi:hypothetical protein
MVNTYTVVPDAHEFCTGFFYILKNCLSLLLTEFTNHPTHYRILVEKS